MKREKNKKERKMDKERKIGETYQIKKKNNTWKERKIVSNKIRTKLNYLEN